MCFRMTIFSILLASSLMGQTVVSGPVSGQWTSRDNPIQLSANAVIEVDDTLTIGTGVVIDLGSSFELRVQGTLVANGTLFSNGCEIFGDDGQLILDDCEFLELDEGVRVFGGQAFINNCQFNSTNQTGITFSGSDSSTIRNSLVVDSGDYGIKITGTDLVEVTGNTLKGNSVNDFNHPALFIDSCSPQVIEHNIIQDNHAQGIGVWTLTSAAAPVIRNNIVRRNFTGITVVNSPPLIDGNIIVANYQEGNSDSGAGIFAGYPNSMGTVTHNFIAGNYYGVSNISSAALNLGDMVNDYPGDDGENIFLHNGLNGQTWHIWNSTSNPILAQNNHWPGMDIADVDATLWDDEEGGGEIVHQPIYVAPLPVPPDVNDDEIVNILDVVSVIEILLDGDFPSALDFYLADINRDYEIDINDVVTIIEWVVGE